MAPITVKGMVKALKKVPEKKFRIAELAPELLDKSGKVDVAKCIERLPEINMAIAEVQTYVKGTKTITDALSRIGGTPVDNRDDDEAEEEDEG